MTENLTKEEILQRLFEKWRPQVQTEIIPAVESYGRIPAEDQTVQYNLPVVRAASMDGIAVDSRRFAGGLPDTSSWRSGVDYVRADTGDDFDDAFDSVIRIEDIDLHKDGSVSIHLPEETPFQRGMNVRSAGSTMRKGETIVAPDRRSQLWTWLLCSPEGLRNSPSSKNRSSVLFPPEASSSRPAHRRSGGRISNPMQFSHLI